MPIHDLDHLLEQVERFVNTPSLAESCRLVETTPELLSEEAGMVLDRLIEANRDDPEMVRVLTDHRYVLRRCREEGIEAAYDEMEHADLTARVSRALGEWLAGNPEKAPAVLGALLRPTPQGPRRLALDALMKTGPPTEVVQAAQEHPILLSDEMDRFLRQLAKYALDVEADEVARSFEERRGILKQIREMGVGSGRQAETVMARLREQAAAMRARLAEDRPAGPAADGEGDTGGRPGGE